MNYVSLFYKKYLDLETKVYFLGIFLIALFGLTYILINYFFFHYTGAFYIPAIWINILPVMAALLMVALCTQEHAPRLAYFTKSYTLYYFIFLSLAVQTTGIQYTPFPLIDKYLVIADQWMGFYTLSVLNWTYAHPLIQTICSYCYESLGFQLIILPLFIAFLMDKSAIRIYFLTLIITYLIGMTTYYFFPTAGPTAIFHSPHFIPVQHDTFLKFFEVHHRLLLTTLDGGMIAFPSFHVIWAVLLTYLCRNQKWLFYPIIILNIGVIASTVFLGWHYLTDVIAGILLAVWSIILAHKISRKIGE
jgi:membrane-associated phospholipid phosphatase